MVTLSQFSQVCAYSFVINDAHSVSQTKNPSGSPTDSARDSSVPAQLLTGTAIVVLVVVVSSVVVVVSFVVLGALMLVSGADVVAVASLLSFDEQLARRPRERSAMMLRRLVLVKVIR